MVNTFQLNQNIKTLSKKNSVELERIDLCNLNGNTASKQVETVDYDDASNHTIYSCGTDSIITLNQSFKYEMRKLNRK